VNNVQEKNSSRNILFWIIVGAFVLVMINFLRISIENRGQIFSDSASYNVDTYDSENMELGPKSKVITTLYDNTYHLRGCKAITGTTEKMNYYTAVSKLVTPCSICISDGL